MRAFVIAGVCLAVATGGCTETRDGAAVHSSRFELRASGEILHDGRPLPDEVALSSALMSIAAEMNQEPSDPSMEESRPVPRDWMRVRIDPAAPFRVVWPFFDACMSPRPIWKLLISSGEIVDFPVHLDKWRRLGLSCGYTPVATWQIEGHAGSVRHVFVSPEGERQAFEDAERLADLAGDERFAGIRCGPEVPWSSIQGALQALGGPSILWLPMPIE